MYAKYKRIVHIASQWIPTQAFSRLHTYVFACADGIHATVFCKWISDWIIFNAVFLFVGAVAVIVVFAIDDGGKSNSGGGNGGGCCRDPTLNRHISR